MDRWTARHIKKAVAKARKGRRYRKSKSGLTVSTVSADGMHFRVHITSPSVEVTAITTWLQGQDLPYTVHDGVGGGRTIIVEPGWQ
jgi:hypothetical protein